MITADEVARWLDSTPLEVLAGILPRTAHL